MSETFNFDLLFIRRFIAVLVYMRNETTLVLIFFLFVLSIISEAAIYTTGMITGEYYKILGDKDWDQFLFQTTKALIFIICLTVLKSCKDFVSATVFIEWRKNLTKKLHFFYFSHMSYYSLNVINREKDNLDQRITQDVEDFARHLAKVLPELLVSPFIIAFYTYRSSVTIGYIGPLICVTFFLISTVLNKWLISSVLKSVYWQQRAEGNFRFQHIHVRNSAESIAFLGGHDFEFNKSDKLLNKLISIQERLILRELRLDLSVNLFDYLGSIISFIVISVPLFAGKFDSYSATDLSQLISQNGFVTIYLINCFTRLIDTSTEFTIIGGTTHRIAEVFELMDRNQDFPKSDDSNPSLNYLSTDYSRSIDETKVYFKLNNVTIKVPKSDRILINRLNLEMTNDSNLLISGGSGTAKTSILRVLKGIWKETTGSVDRYLPFDDPKAVLFLPQKPVMTTGSLFEQICYPLRPDLAKSEAISHLIKEQIIQLMTFLELRQILERIEYEIERVVDWNWYDSLSPGEQQRISFVRLFYHRPLLAFLDESTSAVSLQMERKIYEECNRLKIVVISCGHRQSLEEYHSKVLRIRKSNNPIDMSPNEYVIERL